MKAWNLKQLWNAYNNDLKSCKSDFEAGMIKAVCFKEIRELCVEIEKTRKLTPMEEAIKDMVG